MGSHECMTVECNIYANVQEWLSEGLSGLGNDPRIECNVQHVFFQCGSHMTSDVFSDDLTFSLLRRDIL